MGKEIWRALRAWLTGRRLARAVERNERAARQLDLLVREVMKR